MTKWLCAQCREQHSAQDVYIGLLGFQDEYAPPSCLVEVPRHAEELLAMLEQAGKASRVCTYRYGCLVVAAVFDLLV